ncbi:uncharacterized protein LOC115230256 [Octopus sinensis]|uniref:Uncharacterized protein LOC115230256 n=1 Tax=Octopus sinensis TaxID=2607531 RepID=A0A6P7U478_9MOLL|nr:uncharacterized protein LOC115230256 [Octopus sinensis]
MSLIFHPRNSGESNDEEVEEGEKFEEGPDAGEQQSTGSSEVSNEEEEEKAIPSDSDSEGQSFVDNPESEDDSNNNNSNSSNIGDSNEQGTGENEMLPAQTTYYQLTQTTPPTGQNGNTIQKPEKGDAGGGNTVDATGTTDNNDDYDGTENGKKSGHPHSRRKGGASGKHKKKKGSRKTGRKKRGWTYEKHLSDTPDQRGFRR